jgi:hypothetical protein
VYVAYYGCDHLVMSTKQDRKPVSLTASGRPAFDLAEYRRRKYEKAQERLRMKYERGQAIPRIR